MQCLLLYVDCAAQVMVVFSLQWDLQAQARVHRLGQKKPVHVYRLCTGGTIEERIQQRAEKKLYLDQMVNRGVLSQGISACLSQYIQYFSQ